MATRTGARIAVVDGDGSGALRKAVLALDIGGTKLAAGVVDESGGVRSFVVAPSDAHLGPERGLERLFSLGRTAVGDSGLDWSEIGAVGIGCGGPLDADRGVLLSPPHLPGWRDVPVTALAAAAYDKRAMLANDLCKQQDGRGWRQYPKSDAGDSRPPPPLPGNTR